MYCIPKELWRETCWFSTEVQRLTEWVTLWERARDIDWSAASILDTRCVWAIEGDPVRSFKFQIASGCVWTVNLASPSYIRHSAVTGNQSPCLEKRHVCFIWCRKFGREFILKVSRIIFGCWFCWKISTFGASVHSLSGQFVQTLM